MHNAMSSAKKGLKSLQTKLAATLVSMAMILAAALVSGVAAPAAVAAVGDGHTVDTVSPAGTTINMFDYWITQQDANDAAFKNGAENYPPAVDGTTGINTDHQLQFTPGGSSLINQWTGFVDGQSHPALGIKPRSGMVKNTLVDGYPELQRNEDANFGISRDESLAYLFDSSSQAGKASYLGATGLLQVKDGYYEYNSTENFASFNTETKAFSVYDKPAIYQNNNFRGQVGQFFPFYSADQVFDESRGQLTAKEIDAGGRNEANDQIIDPTNHYFGLTMSSRFVQPENGLTNDKKPMTFEFSGDDDVWVFVDGVLVGDLGGNHSAASLKIDFQNGNIVINENTDQVTRATLKECFDAAGVSSSWDADRPNTFADGTQHKLDFFYLERGNVDSNMRLKYNLVTIPASDILKVNQNGEAVEGASFELYKADGVYKAQGEAIAKGTTDANGQLDLTSVIDNSIINFDDLYAEDNGSTHYLLKETKVPKGYRTGLSNTDMSMHLLYTPRAGESGIITDAGGTTDNGFVWQNGAFTATRETLTAPSMKELYLPGDGTAHGEKVDEDKVGIIFAVILKRDMSKGLNDSAAWHAISGDPLKGYKVENGVDMADVLNAAKTSNYVLQLNTSGQYQTEIAQLPGDIQKYYYILGNNEKDQTEYAVGFYYTEADSLASAQLNDTHRLWGDNFTRQFSSRLYVPNTYNYLYVQKDDGAGNYIAGAEFGLYDENSVTVNDDGKATLNKNTQPIDTATTVAKLDGENQPDLEGAAQFPSEGKRLDKGTYWLKETKAPDGYEINDTLVKVIVDDTGVYADAGSTDDGVSTMVGVGRLVKTMAQFAAQNEINATLSYIKGTAQTGTEVSNGLQWEDAADAAIKTLHLSYGANDALLEYGPRTAGEPVSLETDTGWLRLGIQQDDRPEADTEGVYTDLGGRNLNPLFSGSTCVRVTDEPTARLQVTKTVKHAEGLIPDPDAEFTFKFTLPADGKYSYRIYEKGESGSEQLVTLNGETEWPIANGSEVKIKDGQTIRVYGLKNGAAYSVQEVSTQAETPRLSNLFGLLAGETSVMPAGFKLTERKVGGQKYEAADVANDTISGTIIADQTGQEAVASANQLEFVNTYEASSVTLPSAANFSVKKELTGRTGGTWTDADSFTMVLQAVSYNNSEDAKDEVPLPAGNGYDFSKHEYTTTITSGTNDHKVTFSGLEYSKPGTYVYNIFERTPDTGDRVPGMAYSDAHYKVTVTVVDLGKSQLAVKSVVMRQTAGDTTGGSFTPVNTGSVVFIGENGSVLDTPTTTGTLTATITNTFTEKTASEPLNVTKVYNNASGTNENEKDKFQFSLKPVSVDNDSSADAVENMPLPGMLTLNKDGVAIVGADTDGTAAFGSFTFSNDEHVGHTYAYELREVIPSGANADNEYTLNGMTYDPAVWKVTYKVSANGDGSVKVETSWTKDGASATPVNDRPVFTNTFAVTPATADLKIKKTLSNRDWTTDDQFEFTVTRGRNNPADGASFGTSVKNSVSSSDVTSGESSATITYGKLTFTKVGTYTYTVKENQPTGASNGIAYDTHSVTVTYTVSDLNESKNHTGELAATVKYDNAGGSTQADKDEENAAAFTNTYTASGAYAGITVTKKMAGKKLSSRDYTFTIEKVSPNAPNVPNDSASFTNGAGNENNVAAMSGKLAMNFDQTDIGNTYVYKVSETKPSEAQGYKYDTAYPGDAYVYIAVKANGGSIYTVTTVVKGPDATGSLTDETIDSLDENKNLVETYDSSKPDSGTPTVPFVNEYGATLDYQAKGGLKISKSFESTSGTSDVSSEFKFLVTPKDSKSIDQGGEETTLSTAEEAGDKLGITGDAVRNGKTYVSSSVALGSSALIDLLPESGLTFTQSDADKTYTYEVKEVIPSTVSNKYTYDDTVYTVTIAVKDNGDGTLTATTIVTKPGAGENANPVEVKKTTVSSNDIGDAQVATIPFVNKYTPASGNLTITKTVVAGTSGEPVDSNQKFEFIVTLADSANQALTGTYSFSGTSDGSTSYSGTIGNGGKIVLANGGSVSITGLPAGTNYTVTETAVAGYSQSSTDSTGTIPEGVSATAAFTNTFTPGSATNTPVDVKKVLEGNRVEGLQAGEFSFAMSVEAAEGSPDGGFTLPTDTTAENAADGSVTFGDITFTKVGTYKVTVKEIVPDPAAEYMTYDTHEYTYEVKVQANGSALTATVQNEVGSPIFTNTYNKPTPPTPPQPTDPTPVTWKMDPGLKVLTGRDLKAGEFTFELVDASGKVIDTTTNDANGNFRFDGITYDEAGTYTYTVREVNGGKVIDGVTYDDTIYTITVTVTEVNGKLVANTAITANGQTADDIVFRNAYEAKPAEDIEVDATKKLTGRDLKAGEFEFQLRDADGNVVATAKNGADGRIVFADLTFDKPGTYEYTLVEVAGNATGITYDKSSHKVTITVTDDLKGQLIAEVAYDGGSAPVFTNTFTSDKPGENNENKTPGDGGTSDTTPGKTADTGVAVSGLVALATGLLLAGVTLVGVRRRNSLGTARGHHLTK